MRLIDRLAMGRKAIRVVGSPENLSLLPTAWIGDPALGFQEHGAGNFDSFVRDAYKASGVVFACTLARVLVFSEARFMFQRLRQGRPGDLFATPALDLINGDTGHILARMEQDGSLEGNAFLAKHEAMDGSERLRRLRPDWVTVVTGSRSGDVNPAALDSEVIGYLYHPGGMRTDRDSVILDKSQVAHYAPVPDPQAQWRGMSWLTPVLREIKGDVSASDHKLAYFRNGAVGGVAVSYDPRIPTTSVERFAAMFDAKHAGTANAYKAFHFGGGADVTNLSANMQQLDFKATQGAGESRIAAASGVGAVIAQLSEGLQGSALNAGNFSAAKRRFADGTMRPLWRSAAGALATLIPPPSDARLWYDTRDVAFLQEDQQAEAEILRANADTIRSLTDAGYEPDAVVAAVMAGDLRSLIGSHSGLYSVQLRAPGSAEEAEPEDPPVARLDVGDNDPDEEEPT